MTCDVERVLSAHPCGQTLAAREAGNISSCVLCGLIPAQTPGVQLPLNPKVRMDVRRPFAEADVL